jgi:hypothetical protein
MTINNTGLVLPRMLKAIITGWIEPRQISFTGKQIIFLK